MMLSDADLRTLIEALGKTSFNECRLEAEGYSLLLRREGSLWTAETAVRAESDIDSAAQAQGDEGREDDRLVIRSPMAGVFYRAPKPGAPPFVDVGSVVDADTVVGITEMMKLMNSIHAGVSGRITHIAVGDAAVVEAGQVLMPVLAWMRASCSSVRKWRICKRSETS